MSLEKAIHVRSIILIIPSSFLLGAKELGYSQGYVVVIYIRIRYVPTQLFFAWGKRAGTE